MGKVHKRIRIAYLTARDPQDRLSWSGTMYCMAQALEKHCGEVYHIGPIDASREKLVGRLLNKSSRLFLKKDYMYSHSFLLAKRYAKVAMQRLTERSFDVIIAPSGATAIAFLKTDIPVVLIEDATFGLLQNYYPEYSNLLKRSIQEMNTIEFMALQRASVLVSTSEWAARSAIKDYHAEQQKVFVVPIGANLEHPPPKELIRAKKKSDLCRLLFLGISWQRKGGEIAFETLLKLEGMGIKAELIVCGCTPPKTFSHERMRVIPFLNKNDHIQRKELENLLITSDFLLLPTRSECYGVVFCEANAFGLPVISTNTGGVSGVVRNGENGFLLPLSARGAEYAELIAKIYQDDQRYAELVRSSRVAFDERLDWDAWGITMKKILDSLLQGQVSQMQQMTSISL